jgi:hypothetical protein
MEISYCSYQIEKADFITAKKYLPNAEANTKDANNRLNPGEFEEYDVSENN